MNAVRRLTLAVMGTILAAGLLASCKAKEDSAATVTEEIISESVESEIAEKEETVEEFKYPVSLSVSEWGYENVEYINQKYSFAYNGRKWIVIYNDSGREVDWPFKFEDEVYAAEFDSVYMNLQGGCFIGVVIEEDGTYTSALFDPNAEIIRFKLHKNTGTLVDYRDNLLIAETTGKDGTDYYYIISINDRDYGYTAYKREKLPFLRSSYGIFNLSFKTFYTDIRTCGWRFNSYDVRDYIDDKTEEKPKLLEYAESVNNSFEDKAVRVWPNTCDRDGWVRASVYAVTESKNGSVQFMADSARSGFYNLLTEAFVESPDENGNCSFFMSANGSPKCTVSNYRAAISVTVDDSVSDNDEDNKAYRLFDIRTGDWVGEELYKVVKAFGYHKYVRVKDINDNWTYLDDATMKETGKLYDLASDFCNGYALVVKDEEAYIIDENFEQVSESFKADGVGAALDYLEFSDLNGSFVFYARLGDGVYHMITADKLVK